MRPVGEDAAVYANHDVAPGEILVWQISLVASAHRVSRLRALLSDVERDREERLRFDRDRTRFVGRRGAVRSILSRWWMTSFEPGGGYVAALAVAGSGCHVSRWAWFGEDA